MCLVYCNIDKLGCRPINAPLSKHKLSVVVLYYDTVSMVNTPAGVDVPDDCWMRVGEKKRVWQNGKALVLDTSFEHETGNNSRRDRIVLIIDFWHPGDQYQIEFPWISWKMTRVGVLPWRNVK